MKTSVADDEGPRSARPGKIPSLKPVFKKDGTVTAANASSINDAAAAVVLMSAERARKDGRQVLARVTAPDCRRSLRFLFALREFPNYSILGTRTLTAPV